MTNNWAWRERYDELIDFVKRYKRLPTLRPSAVGTKQYSLASWLAHQRKKKREGKLSPRQANMLQQVGVVWNPGKENRIRWEEQYKNLVEFRKAKPKRWLNWSSTEKKERTLARWCYYNRLWYHGRVKEVGKFPKYRIQKLNEIGFEWVPSDRNKRWQKNYEEVKRFRKKHPNKWPSPKNYHLYKWVQNQRIRYHKGSLEKNRINLLKKIGFDWKP